MEVNEKLAAQIVKLWIEHTKFILEKCELNEDGTLTIPNTFAKYLAEISRTSYDELNVAEKECIKIIAIKIQELLLGEETDYCDTCGSTIYK